MPPQFTTAQRLASESIGTAFLLAAIVGSGIMGENLSGGNVALALLANTLATGAALIVLITMLGPVSGAHFNPVVTLVLALRGELAPGLAMLYSIVQTGGAIAGVLVAHAMFDQHPFQLSEKLRDGSAQALSESVATFGLVAVILAMMRFKPDFIATGVGLYITAAYWFTASTSFANPAVTIARSMSSTFAGIAPSSVPIFVGSQLAGAVAAFVVFRWLLKEAAT
jgi:glycerol uptake facilitator-like aquaporin